MPLSANDRGEAVAPPTTDQTTLAPNPRADYVRRLEARRALGAHQARLHQLVGNARILVFLGGAGLAWLVLGAGRVAPAWLAVPAVAFLFLGYWLERITRAWRRADRAVAFYQRGLGRLDHQWIGQGEPGNRYLDETHPCAADLDLFGTGSLFELLCTARTRTGEDTLAAWLRAPAEPEEVCARQAAVAELRPLLDLREDLSLLGGSVRAAVDLDGLARWGAAEPVLVSPYGRAAALLLAVASAAAALAWATLDVGPTPLMVSLLLSIGLYLWLRERVHRVLEPVERRAQDLAILGGILARLEREAFTAPRLRELRAALDTEGLPPSQRIGQLIHRIDWLNAQRNQFFLPVAVLLLWPVQFAFALEAWRIRWGPAVGRWLTVVGEFEALTALAGYAYENPADPFPDVLREGPCFDGEGLGHPLMPASRCVRNDLRLGGDLRLLVVSGSNMSGKSTLLRTVGINAVLALAGAPVRARRLTLSPLVVGATLRIQDSLHAGKSRFFAEITRARQLVDLAKGPLPLLFLLDEILHGTNSHDRRLGAEAVVRSLVGLGAIGLVTTHDLALTQIADQLKPAAGNVHFADHFENGTMTFDYRMQPGVVQHSNALALMRAVGLEV
jgi:hypothetical protein